MAEFPQPDFSGAGRTPIACPRVAVVAIHGIGHHEAGASANAMANLLLGVHAYSDPHGNNPYGSFTETEIQIPLPGAAIFFSPHGEKPTTPKLFRKEWFQTVLEERRGFFADKFRRAAWGRADAQEKVKEADLASEFMQMQLEGYAGDPLSNEYITRRLAARRTDSAGQQDRDVHIYEMYWADLSRPANSFISFFMSLYQLLLHLTSLGRIAVDFASLEHMGKWDWFVLGRLYAYAARIFTLGVWILLALLAGVAFSPLPLLLGTGTFAMSAAAGVLLLSVVLGVWKLGGRWGWLLPAAALSVAGTAALFLWSPPSVSYVLTAEWWGIAVLVLRQVYTKYDEVRPGAIEAGKTLTGLVIAIFVFCIFLALWDTSGEAELALRLAAFWLVQYLAIGVRAAWIIFMGFALLACLAELVCLLRLRNFPESLARARAALRTGRFTLALPAVLLLLLTLFLWSGVYQFTASRVQLYCGVHPTEHALPGALRHFLLTPQETDRVLGPSPVSAKCPAPGTAADPCSALVNPYRYLEGLLFQAAPPGFPVILGLIIAGFLLLALMVVPSALMEFQTPIYARNGPARHLADWLSRAYHSFRELIWCFWTAAFAAPFLYLLVFAIAYGRGPHPTGESYLERLYFAWGMQLTRKFLMAGGAVLAGSAAVLFGVLVKNGSSALDAILDVDTYLRTSPAHAVPRARIAERYVALLHYLNTYRDADGRGYDRIILVAHSLGSNITADLLRFLHRGRMERLTRFAFTGNSTTPVPLYFFSMGSPLRQLLNRFFPHLYRWVCEAPESTGNSPAPSDPHHPIPVATPPDPAEELNVKQWINFYRSGDYVGRSIWVNDWYQRTGGGENQGAYPEPLIIFVDAGKPPTRVEACIGLGAHTHYWDRTAPDVAEKLNELI